MYTPPAPRRSLHCTPGHDLREIERAIVTRDPDRTKEQIEHNKAIQRILADARKAFSK